MYKIKSKKTWIIALMIILSMGLNGCFNDKDGVVAEVNGEEISQEEYDMDFEVHKNSDERKFGEGYLKQQGPDGKTEEDRLKEYILDKLILETIIIQEAEKKGIELTDKEIEKRLDEEKEALGGGESFKESLDSNGISIEYFTQDTIKKYIMEKYKADYLQGVNIEEENAKDYFELNKTNLITLRASHILLNNEDDAKKILNRLKAGEKFESLALQESLHVESGALGGDLGEFKRGKYSIKDFEDAAFELEVGETSDVIKTEVGYHIIYLQDRKDTFDELEDEIIMRLKEEDYVEHIEELKSKSKIKTYLEINNKE